MKPKNLNKIVRDFLKRVDIHEATIDQSACFECGGYLLTLKCGRRAKQCRHKDCGEFCERKPEQDIL